MNEMPHQKVLQPTVGAAYGHGWNQMWKYFLELLLITIISFLITLPAFGLYDENFAEAVSEYVSIDLILVEFHGVFAYTMMAIAFLILVEWPLEYGMSYGFLRSSRNQSLQVKDIFYSFKNYLNTVYANLLVAVIVGVGIVLIIVPGIIFACKLAFVPYLVVDSKMDAISAIKTSWNLTRGHATKIFLMGVLAFFVGLLGLILVGVGLILSIMWIRLSFASLYYAVAEAQTSVHES
jgi:hypothetical protein